MGLLGKVLLGHAVVKHAVKSANKPSAFQQFADNMGAIAELANAQNEAKKPKMVNPDDIDEMVDMLGDFDMNGDFVQKDVVKKETYSSSDKSKSFSVEQTFVDRHWTKSTTQKTKRK